MPHQAADDQGAGPEAGVGHDAVVAVAARHHARRGVLAVVGADGPVRLVEVQGRHRVQQVHVGFVVSVEAAHVPPVAVRGDPAPDPAELVGADPVGADHGGDDVLAEVVAGVGLGRVGLQDVDEQVLREGVDAHGHQGRVRLAGDGLGVLRLLLELHDAAVRVDGHDAEGAGLRQRHLHAGHGQVRRLFVVGREHGRVVHAVDVIRRQDQYLPGRVPVQQEQVLVDGVRRAGVPVGPGAHLGRHHGDVLAALRVVDGPAIPQVLVQGVGLVLGQDQHPAQARVQAVGQGEVDDPVLAAEGHRRLGAVRREGLQARAAAARQEDHQGIIGHEDTSKQTCQTPCREGPDRCEHAGGPVKTHRRGAQAVGRSPQSSRTAPSSASHLHQLGPVPADSDVCRIAPTASERCRGGSRTSS